MPSSPADILALCLEPIAFFNDPGKRLYWLYLLSGLALAVVLARRAPGGLKPLLQWRTWANHSTLLDLQWLWSNHVLRTVLVVPLLGGQVAFAMVINRWLYENFGGGDFFSPPQWATTALFTLVLFLAEDFSRFLLHYAHHRIPLLWRFHAVHHGATRLNPLTLYRIHWMEMFLASCRSVSVTGLVSGLFIYSFKGQIGPYEVLGASIFNLLFNLAGANLRHSPVRVEFGRLEKWLVSPAQHQIHHSALQQHLDRNMGSILSIWDRLFRCWTPSRGELIEEFGLYQGARERAFHQQLLGHPDAFGSA